MVSNFDLTFDSGSYQLAKINTREKHSAENLHPEKKVKNGNS